MNKPFSRQLFAALMRTVTLASLTALATTSVINQPSYAGSATFYCGKSKGLPVTFARTQDGRKVTIIRWTSNAYFPPPWTAQRRCEEVSRRFQRSNDNGTLKNITTGIVNGEPVVCAGTSQNPNCTSSNLLFTLKRGVNPSATLRRLLDRRGLAAGNNPLDESASDTINIDFERFLESATVEPD
ncbi:COP23 domain-containing protein [Sphaerospermopsis aphanizomenoides BCCUSP55]|uniref:COP23 domain-containing protein n=1 Tax=Sphaerospermopsis aphanizomenoides TaxID=459663 RepID=UPI0019082BEB|nr:COP23 domain-containing protein [Sphaerospermopsis aphanizomenoides]MBK1988767.1 COP23 domain-containing protein [Sphaerospermopsis aphanizomenoides BCCUSP55]